MSMQFQPGVTVAGTFRELPGPVTKLQVQDHWDFDRFQPLLGDGDHTVGLARQGVDVSIQGTVAMRGSLLLLSEAEMFAEVQALRLLLQSQAEALFDVYLFRDETTETCRYFKQCSVARFQYDLTQPELYSYSLVFHADDPTIYSVWPAA